MSTGGKDMKQEHNRGPAPMPGDAGAATASVNCFRCIAGTLAPSVTACHVSCTSGEEIQIMTRIRSIALSLVLVLGLAACASGPQPGEVEVRRGTIEQITALQLVSNHHQGVGAVVGGLAGLGIGSLIGGGTGRDVAMVAGAIGGALVGNEVQKKHDQPVAGQQIIVRTSNGVLVAITQPANPGLRVGQRVYIEGSGDGARVVPR
jgi:outer membrane lipoprotein SlyB